MPSAELLAVQLAGHGPVYALLDAARAPAVLTHIEQSGEPFESLLAGRRARQLAAVAPYLALVSTGSPLLQAFAREGWGQSWGTLLTAWAPLAAVRRHLRRFLTVETEAGEALWFRFYDPRVLRPFLASATEEERRAFFGPITAFFLEGDEAGTLVRVARPGPPVRAPEPPWDLPRIRDEQCAVFAGELVRAFVDRNLRRLAEGLARWAPDAAAARTLVTDAMARAEVRGIEGAGEIERYLDLVVALGPAFDERLPWAREILAREDLGATHKLSRLERGLRRRRP